MVHGWVAYRNALGSSCNWTGSIPSLEQYSVISGILFSCIQRVPSKDTLLRRLLQHARVQPCESRTFCSFGPVLEQQCFVLMVVGHFITHGDEIYFTSRSTFSCVLTTASNKAIRLQTNIFMDMSLFTRVWGPLKIWKYSYTKIFWFLYHVF